MQELQNFTKAHEHATEEGLKYIQFERRDKDLRSLRNEALLEQKKYDEEKLL